MPASVASNQKKIRKPRGRFVHPFTTKLNLGSLLSLRWCRILAIEFFGQQPYTGPVLKRECDVVGDRARAQRCRISSTKHYLEQSTLSTYAAAKTKQPMDRGGLPQELPTKQAHDAPKGCKDKDAKAATKIHRMILSTGGF